MNDSITGSVQTLLLRSWHRLVFLWRRAAVAGLVLGIATAATAFPACRAARIDPLQSLRLD